MKLGLLQLKVFNHLKAHYPNWVHTSEIVKLTNRHPSGAFKILEALQKKKLLTRSCHNWKATKKVMELDFGS